MTILVTGAAGFIGMHLSEKLLKEGHKVVGFDNLNDYYDVQLKNDRLEQLTRYDNFTFIKGNLEDNDALTKLFEKFKIEIVVHLAAQAGVRHSISNPSLYIQSNIVGFSNVIELSKNHNVQHFLYASSSSVYGMSKTIPFSTEDNVDHPISMYAATKKSNELIAHTYSHLFNLKTTGLRFFTVYGPYGRPDMAYFSFTKRIINGESIKLFNNGDMMRDFTFIDDIVEGIYKVMIGSKKSNEKEIYKLYNIGNNKPVKLLSFVETLENLLGIKAYKEFLPMQRGDVKSTYANIDNLKRDFSFEPKINIEKGLKEFVTWYKDYYHR
ncbi:NAD-dependent epimerase/dehydratase family protein [Marinilactibacillus sp. Marseille-P9653]|uniref:NAD-dependent epimerase/dehydratase family protein n=1 Tax=Marinilactibacillus sp. Marseille-P9653 TaxID=2866583 RepID=UPI001CE478BC|nr:NAD-dependent epimerase/dehydratase family protein [Marinilactibacillus sp. Marseille-P9653]